jgi:cell division transport system permease protein
MAETRVVPAPQAVPAHPRAPAAGHTRRLLAPRPSPIIPSSGVAGRPLFLVVTAMCYLASITLGASLLVRSQIAEWTADISNEATVQVRPVDGFDIESTVAQAVSILAATEGVVSADPMSARESSALLEPWLGSANVLEDLPIPRLIAVEIDLDNPPDMAALATTLANAVEGASIDDHRRWRSSLTRMASSLQLVAMAVIILVGATTAAIIVFATRAAIAGNREIIEVLHLTGATESFIAYQIQKRFLLLGLVSGLIGAVLAVLTFLVLNTLSGAVAAGSFTGAPSSLMFGSLSLPFSGYVLFGLVAVAAAVIGVVTSRVVVMSVLRSIG